MSDKYIYFIVLKQRTYTVGIIIQKILGSAIPWEQLIDFFMPSCHPSISVNRYYDLGNIDKSSLHK